MELGEFTMDLDPNEGRVRQRVAFHGVFDPPEFESLAASPPLQEAARRTCRKALLWWRDNPGSIRTDASNPKDARADRISTWSSRKSVAEAVIEEYQVSSSRVNAGIIVMGVAGRWSRIEEPGVLLCSEETFADDALFPADLKKAFETGLRRSA
jgi:hypothetical protein